MSVKYIIADNILFFEQYYTILYQLLASFNKILIVPLPDTVTFNRMQFEKIVGISYRNDIKSTNIFFLL